MDLLSDLQLQRDTCLSVTPFRAAYCYRKQHCPKGLPITCQLHLIDALAAHSAQAHSKCSRPAGETSSTIKGSATPTTALYVYTTLLKHPNLPVPLRLAINQSISQPDLHLRTYFHRALGSSRDIRYTTTCCSHSRNLPNPNTAFVPHMTFPRRINHITHRNPQWSARRTCCRPATLIPCQPHTGACPHQRH